MGPPTLFGWFSSGSFLIQGNRFGRIWDFSVFEFDGETNAVFTEVLLGTRRTRAHTETQKIFLGRDFILSINRHFRSSTNNFYDYHLILSPVISERRIKMGLFIYDLNILLNQNFV